jgi:pimeloyl-ACP methyl ester carboxylesterase
MQSAIMILTAFLVTIALMLVIGVIYQITGTWRDRRRFPPPGRVLRSNNRRMHIRIAGEGSPTVVFESGMGASCLSWTLIRPQVARFSRTVSYDCAGHGWSDTARGRQRELSKRSSLDIFIVNAPPVWRRTARPRLCCRFVKSIRFRIS